MRQSDYKPALGVFHECENFEARGSTTGSSNSFAIGGNGSLPVADGVGVDKIRDLLFGNQMQDYDRRFSKLEERFLQRFKDIESETARNLSAFEMNAKKQVDSLAGQLREEKESRADADKEIERTMREHNQGLEKRLRSMSDQLSQLERDMSDRLTQEAQSLRDEIKRKNEDLQQMLEKMFAELSNVKTDRNLLAVYSWRSPNALVRTLAARASAKRQRRVARVASQLNRRFSEHVSRHTRVAATPCFVG